MRMRTRKFVGTIVLVVMLGAYALIAMSIGAGRMMQAAHGYQTLYYLVAGLAWVIPAGLLIRWMQRPDGE